MLDLGADVVLKGEPRTYEEYCATVRAEHTRAVDWMAESVAQWRISDSLREKVADDGRLLPFFGDTVVLPMNRASIAQCRRLQRQICEAAPGLLAHPLDPATFHVTLHDLSTGSADHPEHAARCRERFGRLARALDDHDPVVRLEPTRVYNCVNVSLVLGLVPVSDDDFRALMNVYNLFEDIVRPSYWPRLHVTLAYLRPTAVDPRVLHGAIPSAIAVAPLHLDLRDLAYQTFESMNVYHTQFSVSDMPHRD